MWESCVYVNTYLQICKLLFYCRMDSWLDLSPVLLYPWAVLGSARCHHFPTHFQPDPASSAQLPLFLSSLVVSAPLPLVLFSVVLPILPLTFSLVLPSVFELPLLFSSLP